MALLRFDGGCRPTNPGHSAFASVLEAGGQTYVVSRYLGIHTNNYAEYTGLLVGVKLAIEYGVRELEIITDSKLIVGQMTQGWKINNVDLKILHGESTKLLTKHYGEHEEDWVMRWQKRDNNAVADDYCTQAINWGRNLNPFTPDNIKDKRGKAAVHDPFRQ